MIKKNIIVTHGEDSIWYREQDADEPGHDDGGAYDFGCQERLGLHRVDDHNVPVKDQQ